MRYEFVIAMAIDGSAGSTVINAAFDKSEAVALRFGELDWDAEPSV